MPDRGAAGRRAVLGWLQDRIGGGQGREEADDMEGDVVTVESEALRDIGLRIGHRASAKLGEWINKHIAATLSRTAPIKWRWDWAMWGGYWREPRCRDYRSRARSCSGSSWRTWESPREIDGTPRSYNGQGGRRLAGQACAFRGCEWRQDRCTQDCGEDSKCGYMKNGTGARGRG